MNEKQWLKATRPFPCRDLGLKFGSVRKLRLLMVGYLEPLQPFFTDESRAVFLMLREWAETGAQQRIEPRWAAVDGPLRDSTERSPRGLASSAMAWIVMQSPRIDRLWFEATLPSRAAQALAFDKMGPSPIDVPPTHPKHQTWSMGWKEEFAAAQLDQVATMKCVYGNPFRPVTFDEAWLTWRDATVVRLAEAIYAERAFERLPILADALEESGCTNEKILGHCRRPGLHVRGCWVVDGVLKK
ncbi:MAG: hypothetical protein AB7K24_10100 [Gemmataceae bacterium]